LKLRKTDASTLARPNPNQYPSETNHMAEIDWELRFVIRYQSIEG